ncbi:outer membrane protein assembly factor BamE [Aquabacterium sp.]|uniref:outer membrane protein assembly factor BamE n=1 Tax=Aquabacterium sp. TaxID=1872578 RepID=UPI0039C86E58
MLLTTLPSRAARRATPSLGLLLVAGLLPLWLTGCSSLRDSTLSSPETMFGLLKPYRMEVVQGNVVTQEVMAQIQPGLGRTQVRDILGTPLLADVFHDNRWDYVFTIARQGVTPQQRRVTVFFKNNVVERFESDTLPTEREFVASISRPQELKAAPPDLTEAQVAALPVPPKVDNKPKVPQGAVRDYPPLESGRR